VGDFLNDQCFVEEPLKTFMMFRARDNGLDVVAIEEFSRLRLIVNSMPVRWLTCAGNA